LKYLLAFTIPGSVYLSLIFDGALCWLAVVYAYAFIPLLEMGIGVPESTNEKTQAQVANPFFFNGLLYLTPFIQGFLIFTFLNHFSMENPIEAFAKILALGISCGVIGINVGHELGHRKSLSERLIAIFLLSTSLYSHFYIEHNKGHHRHVATPSDSATARLGENLYSFILRSMVGSFTSAWHLDKPVFLLTQAFQLSCLILIALNWGAAPTLGFLAAAIFGGVNLEVVNYIEHYGLLRKVNPSGRYEKVAPRHSWNSNHPIGRSILFELSRHSDHHAYVAKPYYKLENNEEGPQLPAGYPGMMVLATIPPLFFKVMNPLVKKYSL